MNYFLALLLSLMSPGPIDDNDACVAQTSPETSEACVIATNPWPRIILSISNGF
jgi:hypothetical protein